MLAERLARLLGSILALAMLMGGALITGEPPTYATTGFDWSADIPEVTVDLTTGSAANASQAADVPAYGAF